MRLRTLLAALSLALLAAPSLAVTTFVTDIAAMGPGASTITFDEFAIPTPYQSGVPRPPNALDPSALAVPGHPVHLQSSLGMTTGDFDAFFPGSTVPGLFEGAGTFNPVGSSTGNLFQARFDTPVTAAGLVLFNNFGTTARSYTLRVFDAAGNEIGSEGFDAVATPQFWGFTSDQADIALLELSIGITFNTGRRPFIDTITYVQAPEPALAALAAGAMAGLALAGRRARAGR